eukprot:c11193_g1_i2.p1 GENE.c11193_g1_i2~~c11193_g1_i2.p1  ORF type:complete len:217 (-),score=29.72 c11193_g1_i2:290-940(-)
MMDLEMCWSEWVQDECARILIMDILSAGTLFVVFIQLLSMMHNSPKISLQVGVLHLLTLQLVLLCLHYTFFREIVLLKLAVRFLHITTFCLMCFYFAFLASRIIGRRELVKRILYPLLVVLLSFLTIVFCLAWSFGPRSKSVQNHSWLVLSVVYVVVATAFVGVGFIMTVKFSTRAPPFRASQGNRLWALIVSHKMDFLSPTCAISAFATTDMLVN